MNASATARCLASRRAPVGPLPGWPGVPSCPAARPARPNPAPVAWPGWQAAGRRRTSVP